MRRLRASAVIQAEGPSAALFHVSLLSGDSLDLFPKAILILLHGFICLHNTLIVLIYALQELLAYNPLENIINL